MSSGFVSAAQNAEGDEWVKTQQEVEERRREKAKEGIQEDGKSLYEVLQANKAAKQEAFEEATRLKHQFRTLDDGEVEFLDSVTQAERLKEASVKKANAEGLEAFRRQREEAERIEIEQSINEVRGEDWSTKKKRKRDRENEGGAKLKARRVSSIEGAEADTSVPPKSTVQKTSAVAANSPVIPSTTKSDDNSKSLATPPTTKEVVAKAATGLGLGAYSSDDD